MAAVQLSINEGAWYPIFIASAVVLGVCFLLKWLSGYGHFTEIIGLTMLGMVFHLAADRPSSSVQYNVKHLHIAQVLTEPTNNSPNSRYNNCTAQLLNVQRDSSWVNIENTKAMLFIDTTQNVEIGDCIVYEAKTFPYNEPFMSYYRHKNIIGRQYTYRVDTLGESSTGFSLQIEKTRNAIAQRIYSLRDSVTHATSLMVALVVGTKTQMQYELKNAYRLSGVSHLLAISGLHVGIIVVLLNFLTRPLVLYKSKGAMLQFVVISVSLIIFAILSGLTPSVVRAVVMFILLQYAFVFEGNSDSLNILLASALGLLLTDTKLLFDPGFQLSYLAMIGIILYYSPLRQLFKLKHRVARWFYGLFVISLCAQLFTTPLVIYNFGYISFSTFFVGYLVWFTMPVIIFATLLYLVVPLGFVGEIAIAAANVQNAIVKWFSQFDMFIYRNSELPLWVVIGTYSALILIAVYVRVIYANILINRQNESQEVSEPEY